MFWAIIICFGILVILMLVVYSMPSTPEQGHSKKKEKKERVEAKKIERPALMPDPINVDDGKDWKAIAQRWERQNLGLQGDLEKGKMEQKKLLQDIDAQKQDLKDLIEKLAQEKNWREKEQANVDRAKQREKDLNEQVMRTEKDLEKEHSARLVIERELQEIRIKYDAALEEKRVAVTNAASLDTTVKALTKQVKDLLEDNKELKKKKEDIQWVAKSDYDELMKKTNDLEAQLKKLKAGDSNA